MAGSSWPTLTAGKKARASEVESKFDWLEQSLLPMNSGSTTDLAYDLGSETKRWKGAFVGGLNPTTTAGGVAIGTTTANTSALLDIAGTKALIVPRMTTAARDALTPANGMLIYNTTSNVFQIYQNGGWTGMGGAAIGVITKLNFTGSSGVTATAINIQTSGRLVAFGLQSSAGGTTSACKVILDSMTSGTLNATTTGDNNAILAVGGSVNMFAMTITVGRVDLFFKEQLIAHVWAGAGTGAAGFVYERA